MATWLKQSTAIEIKIGPLLDETDGKTAETGLSISQADVRLAKNAGDWAQKNESTTLVHEENGWYRCLLDTTDTNTLGNLVVAIHESGALPVWREFMVLPAMIYDSFILGTDVLQTDTTQWLGTAASTPTVAGVPNVNAKTWNDLTTVALPLVPTTAGRTLDVSADGEAGLDWANMGGKTTANGLTGTTISTNQAIALCNALGDASITQDTFAVGAITSGTIAADAIGASELAADAVTEIQSGLATAAALDTVDNFLDTEIAAILAAVDTEIAAIKAVTDALPNAGALTSLATAAALDTVDNFIDTEVAAIKAKTDLIPGTIDGKTFSELVTLIAAVLLGKASGLETTTAVYRAVDDSKDRVTATVTADGNRSAITLDPA